MARYRMLDGCSAGIREILGFNQFEKCGSGHESYSITVERSITCHHLHSDLGIMYRNRSVDKA